MAASFQILFMHYSWSSHLIWHYTAYADEMASLCNLRNRLIAYNCLIFCLSLQTTTSNNFNHAHNWYIRKFSFTFHLGLNMLVLNVNVAPCLEVWEISVNWVIIHWHESRTTPYFSFCAASLVLTFCKWTFFLAETIWYVISSWSPC
jgi:hypothetical protein